MRTLIAVLGLSLLLSTGTAAQNTQPLIITLTADPAQITVDAAEAGDQDVTLTWHTVHVADNLRLRLERRSLGEWVLERDNLPASGSLTLPVQHPLDFGPPTYRLILADAAGQVLDERVLPLVYDIAPEQTPQIDLFTADTTTLEAGSLADGSARVTVTWAVSQRLPTAHLVFEQVQGGDQAVSVELPRAHLWVGSQGSGPVAPVAPLIGSSIRLRLRVVDLVSGQVYDEAETVVTLSGLSAAVVPTATPTTEPGVAASDPMTPLPSATPRPCPVSAFDVPLSGAPGDGCDTYRDPRSGAVTRVVAFGIDRPAAGSGSEITLNWQVEGAQFALLEIYDPQQLERGGLPEPVQVYYDGLPLAGSRTITLPAGLSQGARLILWAANLSTQARSPAFLYDRLAYRIIDTAPGAADSGGAEITAFIALPPRAAPGSEISLSWSILGADVALIELYNRGSNTLVGVFEDLPTIGSANLIMPEAFTQGARFVLWAVQRKPDGGLVRLRQAEVEVPAG